MLNELSRSFHPALAKVLEDLHSESPDMKYALGNSFSLLANILKDPKRSGKQLFRILMHFIMVFMHHMH